MCGKPKGKVRFHTHHPDRLNRPDYTIPLCPSCHAKEEARLRKEKPATALTIKAKTEPPPTSTLPMFWFPPQPLSKTEKVLIGYVVVSQLFPNLLPSLWNDIQRLTRALEPNLQDWLTIKPAAKHQTAPQEPRPYMDMSSFPINIRAYFESLGFQDPNLSPSPQPSRS